MIQASTRLRVADNTGARTIECIRIMGRSRKTVAGIGDVIIASVKTAIPNAPVKKGDVVRAVIVRTSQGDRPPRRQLHPLRRERGRAHQQPGQPARHPHLRARRARAPGSELHEDRVPRAGGALMTVRSIEHRTKVPEIRKGDTVVVLAGRDAGKRGTVEQVIRRDPVADGRALRLPPDVGQGWRVRRRPGPQHRPQAHQAAPAVAGWPGLDADRRSGRHPRPRHAAAGRAG